jgi:AcrR family transcriptional regulator
MEELGRRERKKLRTREALIDAAFKQFAERGFEATTVEEIADEVDVSSRTFFRYFSSKEDVVLTFHEEQFARIVEALCARPPEEPVITALRRAIVSVAESYERGEGGIDASRLQCILEMSSQSPNVLARTLEHAQKKQSTLTRILADRMGVDPKDDMRPHVAAAMATCAFQSTAELWNKRPDRFPTLSSAVDAALALIESGVNFSSKAT